MRRAHVNAALGADPVIGKAWRGDTLGDLVFRTSGRSFNPMIAAGEPLDDYCVRRDVGIPTLVANPIASDPDVPLRSENCITGPGAAQIEELAQ